MSFGPRRSDTLCPIFGVYSDIGETQLPTIKDALILILLNKTELKNCHRGKHAAKSEIFKNVIKKLESIWSKTAIPIVSHRRVNELLETLYKKYLCFRYRPSTKKSEKFKHQQSNFVGYCSRKLFDIACCKCTKYNLCICAVENKVPMDQRDFLFDQRGSRQLNIITTAQQNNSSVEHSQMLEEENYVISINRSSDSKRSTESLKLQNRLKLPHVAKVCDRYGISLRSAAAVTSAVLQDVGLISEENYNLVIDKGKIQRAISKSRVKVANFLDGIDLFGLYFDGRKDRTLSNVKCNSRYYRHSVNEEHISIILEPASMYLGHVTPTSSAAKAISDSIINFITEESGNVESIFCIGCDGTATNTGKNGGVIRCLEEKFGRPLQWIICLLHMNELPLRHLLIRLDGPTTGPRGYSGPIGKSLVDCEKFPVTTFLPINGNLPQLDEKVINDLSWEQKYLYNICNAINLGNCSIDLAQRQPGKIGHSRWLTTANRILRLYISSDHPSENLINLVEFIMKVYAPVWFSIKANPLFIQGPHHLFKIIQYSKYMPDNLKSIIHPVIRRNAYFAHPENLLAAMLFDARIEVRDLAIQHIIKARAKISSMCVRTFTPPAINFLAEDYIDMITWDEKEINPPPLIQNIYDEDLISLVKNSNLKIPDIPCHTQSVERCIKTVTEASQQVCGSKSREGLIQNKIKSRSEMKHFNTKKDYFSH